MTDPLTPEDCPWCGEWRDSPTGDCANCGYKPRPCGDQIGICVYAGPHDGPHRFGKPVRDHLDAARADTAALDVERLAKAWGNVMDGRRVWAGMASARMSADTTTPDDWDAIAREYAAMEATDD